jgi:hypothetical protein
VIRYSYNRQFEPPAPFVHVALRHPETAEELANVPAQLDCAADRSVVPLRLVEELGLVPMGEVCVAGLGGAPTFLPAFVVLIEIRQLYAVSAKIVAIPDEPYILLGRDVLNLYRLLLDGPQLTLQIG